ncbi:hypothetical protein PO002_45870 [Cupriavidus necator]|uniref:hypothetical protein n=1 Tax=Cupriavidus necator TaxID=106590 RepID=UPI0039C377AC
MKKKLVAPYIAEAERTPAVLKVLAWGEDLVALIHRLVEHAGHMKDEVAVLRGEKKRPTFKPSRMHEEAGKTSESNRQQQGKPAGRLGSPARSKTGQLKIDCEQVIQPAESIPSGSRFKG